MTTMVPFIRAGKVLKGSDSIHPTEWFISQANAQVILPMNVPSKQPPKPMQMSPHGTKNVAIGSTMRLVSRK